MGLAGKPIADDENNDNMPLQQQEEPIEEQVDRDLHDEQLAKGE